jgi:tetratricopeptide (TPR) repeat protein
MRRFFALSIAATLLGGCSCKGTPGQSSGPVPDAGQAALAPPAAVPVLAAPAPETPFDKAVKAHAQGRMSGEGGSFQDALKHFQAAHELAPEWPLPLYDMAHTHLLMGESTSALEIFAQVDALAPRGFADTPRVLECLRREKDGRVPKGTYRKFLDVLRLRDPEKFQQGLRELTQSAPRFYPAWRELISYGKDLDEQERLLEKALAAKPDALSRGDLLVYKANLLRRRGKDAEARALLQSLVDDPRSLASTVTDAKEALSFTLPP